MSVLKILFTAAAVLISSSAFALSKTDCSSADGKLVRSEEEIWGANKVTYKIFNRNYDQSRLNVVMSSKKVIEQSGDSREGSNIYVAEFNFTQKNGGFFPLVRGGGGPTEVSGWMICSSAWDEFID